MKKSPTVATAMPAITQGDGQRRRTSASTNGVKQT